jgi:trans-aconitate methyltransferase
MAVTGHGTFRDLRLRPALDLLAQVGSRARLRRRGGGRPGGPDAKAAPRSRLTLRLWHPHTPPALIFSNAALRLLVAMLAPGGVLAFPGRARRPSRCPRD